MSDWKTPNEVKQEAATEFARLTAAPPPPRDAVTEIARFVRGINDDPLSRAARGDSDPPELTGTRCWLRLANGWVVSISEIDTPPAICCISAWRTGQDNLPYEELTLFDFGGGIDGHARTDCRCWSFADVREALVKIADAGGAEA
jgi:hypothetical protein